VPTKLTWTGVVVAGASFAAASVTTREFPDVSDNGVGDTVTPVGRPCTMTVIAPLKPSIAVLLNVTCPAAPGVSDSVGGATVSVKSGLTGGVVPTTVNWSVAV
jgi:hypothetical protein